MCRRDLKWMKDYKILLYLKIELICSVELSWFKLIGLLIRLLILLSIFDFWMPNQWCMQTCFGQTGIYIEPTKAPSYFYKFSKFVSPDTLKMHLLALSFLRVFCKIFSKLLNLTLRKTLFRGSFKKNWYIQIKNLYGYKMQSDLSLKVAASST